MELMPRITRAQVMDEQFSQPGELGGGRDCGDDRCAAEEYGKGAIPRTHQGGRHRAGRAHFCYGRGRRGRGGHRNGTPQGGIGTATDARRAAKEQIKLLGAKFVAVEDEEFRQAETAGGYAKEMSREYQAKQAELVSSHIAKQDIVIDDGADPGCPYPVVDPRPWSNPCSRFPPSSISRSSAAEIAKSSSPARRRTITA